MAAATNLTVRISAVDATSAAIDAVSKRLAGLTAPVTKVTRSLARLSDASGVTRLSRAVLHLGGSAVRTSEKFVGALGPLSALTAALSVGGMAKMVTDWAKMSQSLSFDATRIGSGISKLDALEGSARLSGSSAEAAASGLRTLQDTMTDAVGGRNMEAVVGFRALGVAFDDGRGHALRATEVMPKLADALKNISDRSIRARIGTTLLGGAYEELAPWIDQGSAGMAKYAALAEKYGVQTEAGARAAAIFREAQGELTLAFRGLGNSISEKVSPPLADLMRFLANIVGTNRQIVAEKFGQWAERFSGWVKSINWEHVGERISKIAESVASITESLASGNIGAAWRKFAQMLGFGGDAPGVEVTSDGKIAMPRPGGVESDAPPLTPGQHTDRGKLMMGIFEGKGWQHDDAAAIIAGLDRESGLRTGAVGDNGQAYGAAQWHPDRQAQFDAWSKNGGTSDGRDIRHSSMEDQTNFINWDLTKGKYKSVGDHMRGAKTIEEKMAIFDKEYESPADTAGAIKSDIPRARQWAAQDATKPGASVADATHAPADAPSWIDKLEDGPLKRMLKGPSAAPDRDGSVPAASNSKVDVHVRLSGLPPGATATTTTSGDAAAGVKIARAMPQ